MLNKQIFLEGVPIILVSVHEEGAPEQQHNSEQQQPGDHQWHQQQRHHQLPSHPAAAAPVSLALNVSEDAAEAEANQTFRLESNFTLWCQYAPHSPPLYIST